MSCCGPDPDELNERTMVRTAAGPVRSAERAGRTARSESDSDSEHGPVWHWMNRHGLVGSVVVRSTKWEYGPDRHLRSDDARQSGLRGRWSGVLRSVSGLDVPAGWERAQVVRVRSGLDADHPLGPLPTASEVAVEALGAWLARAGRNALDIQVTPGIRNKVRSRVSASARMRGRESV